MTAGSPNEREERGLSARQLVLMFLTGVAVCAVFFAAGFLVGYNERWSRGSPSTENVAPSGVIPPTVNTPAAAEPSGSEHSEAATPAETPAAQTPTPARPPKPAAKPAASAARRAAPSGGMMQGAFWVQVVASSTRPDAEHVIRILKGKGYPAALETPAQAGASDRLFRVRVGPFVTREEAEQVRGRLVHDGYKQPFIKH